MRFESRFAPGQGANRCNLRLRLQSDGFSVYFFFPGSMAAKDTAPSIVENVAEAAFILWLLIMGVRVRKPAKLLL